MLDVFDIETELIIKEGISNLYWFKDDLKKACLKVGVSSALCNELWNMKKANNYYLTKREIMDELYVRLRNIDKNKRLQVSREFVRILIEQKDFTAKNYKHDVSIAELSSLKLKEKLKKQQEEKRKKDKIKHKKSSFEIYENKRSSLYKRFQELYTLSNGIDVKKRGYELENLFLELMKISEIEVIESFKNIGEQIDGAIKFENIHYLVETKWQEKPVQQKDLASLYLKVEGKLVGTRGVFIAINGYSKEMLQSSLIGKELKIVLLDGMHIINVLAGRYTFNELLKKSIEQASLNGKIYCEHDIFK